MTIAISVYVLANPIRAKLLPISLIQTSGGIGSSLGVGNDLCIVILRDFRQQYLPISSIFCQFFDGSYCIGIDRVQNGNDGYISCSTLTEDECNAALTPLTPPKHKQLLIASMSTKVQLIRIRCCSHCVHNHLCSVYTYTTGNYDCSMSSSSKEGDKVLWKTTS